MIAEILTPQVVASAGVAGAMLLLSIKALQQVYKDMRADASAREERLMKYLDTKAETDKQVAQTLKNLEGSLRDLKKSFEEHKH